MKKAEKARQNPAVLQMKTNMAPGKLITFCGLDGCGKTTMIRRLVKELEAMGEQRLFLTKQPTNAVRDSEIFRTYMDTPDHEGFEYRSLSLLAASDRLQHVSKIIQPQLEQGVTVISDRYFYSCLANLRARGYMQDQWIYEIAQEIIRPDLAFFFEIPVVKAVNRVRQRPEEKNRYIDMELQYRLAQEYREICLANGGISVPTDIPEERSYQIVRKYVLELLEVPYEYQA